LCFLTTDIRYNGFYETTICFYMSAMRGDEGVPVQGLSKLLLFEVIYRELFAKKLLVHARRIIPLLTPEWIYEDVLTLWLYMVMIGYS